MYVVGFKQNICNVWTSDKEKPKLNQWSIIIIDNPAYYFVVLMS